MAGAASPRRSITLGISLGFSRLAGVSVGAPAPVLRLHDRRCSLCGGNRLRLNGAAGAVGSGTTGATVASAIFSTIAITEPASAVDAGPVAARAASTSAVASGGAGTGAWSARAVGANAAAAQATASEMPACRCRATDSSPYKGNTQAAGW